MHKLIIMKNNQNKKISWKSTIKSLWNYLAKDKKILIGALCLTLIKTILSVSLSIIIGLLVQETFANFVNSNPEIINQAWIKLLYSSLFILCGYIVYFFLYLTAAKIIIKLSFNLGYKIRDLIFQKIHRMPYSLIQKKMSGDLMAKATIDVNALAVNMSFSISNMFTAPFIVITVYIGLFILSPYLALIMVLMFVISVLGSYFFAKASAPKFKEMQHVIGDMNIEVEEQISNRKVIKLFNLQEKTYDQFYKINLKQKEIATSAETKVIYVFPWNELVETTMLSIMYAVAIVLVSYNIGTGSLIFGEINVGIVTAFSLLAKYANGEATYALRLIGNVQKMLVSGERSLSILDLPNYIDEGTKILENVKGDIEFKNVYFSYNKNKIALSDISFKIPAKTTTAIVGPTGSGKTTMINLLSRFYEIDSGSITIDGYNIKNISQKNLCDNIAVVLQDSFLFSETIRNNIAYGNLKATDEEIIKAARAANIHNFIESLPNKYDTVISERIDDFSDGQIQMIALARAFLSKAPILILDEATSSVDTKTEQDIQNVMLKLMQNKTVIVIAHRLSTIVHANQILVMKSSKIIESGTHEELLKQKGYYSELYNANAVMI